jgi:hypothetical protein
MSKKVLSFNKKGCRKILQPFEYYWVMLFQLIIFERIIRISDCSF